MPEQQNQIADETTLPAFRPVRGNQTDGRSIEETALGKDGVVPPEKYTPEWLAKQPKAFQDMAMEKRRAGLGWRASVQVTEAQFAHDEQLAKEASAKAEASKAKDNATKPKTKAEA